MRGPANTKIKLTMFSAFRLEVAAFRGWIGIAERFGMGSRTLAELIAMQALSRRFPAGRRASK